MDYEKTKKKIKLFKLLEKLKKRDLFRELYNLNIINSEINKTDSLINKIDSLINENNSDKEEEVTLAGFFKDKSKLLNVLNNQKIIAKNKKDFLLEQKKISNSKYSKKLFEKNKIKNEINNKISIFENFKELKMQHLNRNRKNR